MKRQHIVVAYLKKSKRSNADGTETCAVFCISASQYCISNTAVTQIELFRAFKVFLTSDVISLNIIKCGT